jgi:tetratricopeptide (TPR) repeat protein
MLMGRFRKAQEFEKREIEISREIGDKRTVGNGLNNLGVQAYMQGDGKTALSYYEEALEIAREIGNKTGEIMEKSNIAGVRIYLEEYESAENELKTLIDEVGDKGHFLVSEMYRFLAESLIGQGKLEEALETGKKSLYLSEETENQEAIAEAWRVLGIISSCLGKSVLIDEIQFSASDCFQKSLEIFEETGMKVNYAQALHNFAQHNLIRGKDKKAQELFDKEKEISKSLDINTEAKGIYFKRQYLE